MNKVYRFLTENKDLVEANHMQPLYSIDSQDRDFKVRPKEVEFTGYKNKQCIKDMKNIGIPFDGSYYLVKIETGWDGWWILDDLVHVLFGNSKDHYHILDGSGTEYNFADRDPRGNVSTKWRYVSSEGLNKLKTLVHIYGANEHFRYSRIVNGREAMGNYGVAVGYDARCDAVEFVCPRCTDNHQLMTEFVGQPWDFLKCKDVVVIDPFGFTEPWVYPDTPDWPEIISAAASFQEAGKSE